MKVFVINLPNSHDRKVSMRNQLEPLGVNFSFFPAVDRAAGFDSFEAYDEGKFLANTGRTASPGEVGCYASHLELWKHCLERNEPIIILEDDAEVQPNFLASLATAEMLIGKTGFIRLQSDGPPGKSQKTPHEARNAFTLNRYSKYPFGAMAYAISPIAAQRLTDRSRVLNAPVDLVIKRYWEHGQPLFGLSPYSVIGGGLSELTTIQHRVKTRPSIALRISRWFVKLCAAAGRASFNLSQRQESSDQPSEYRISRQE